MNATIKDIKAQAQAIKNNGSTKSSDAWRRLEIYLNQFSNIQQNDFEYMMYINRNGGYYKSIYEIIPSNFFQA